MIQASGNGGAMMARNHVQQGIAQSRGGGNALDGQIRGQMETGFGHDFSSVKIHTGDYAAQMSRDLNARAFTVGNDIYFNRGEYQPGTQSGQHLLAHELTHTVQQGSGANGLIQRTVDRVEINCGDSAIRFHHDATVTSYTLDSCDLTPGTYQANVALSPREVRFTLQDVPPETHFEFGYTIGAGQASPNTFFAGQRTVSIECSNTPTPSDTMTYTNFHTRRLSEADAVAMTGMSISQIPIGRLVPLDSLQQTGTLGGAFQRGMGAAAFTTPTPWSFIPRNVTGVLWTQGHTSIFANPAGQSPSIFGYRGNLGYYAAEMVPLVGHPVTVRLHEGVPGSFANDALFPLMYGEQNYVFQPRTEAESAAFAARLRGTSYGGNYTYSPPRAAGAGDPVLGPVRPSEAGMNAELLGRGRAPMCTNNCITVPQSEIVDAMGSRPTTPSGVDVMTGMGPEGRVDPARAGRGRLMYEAMRSGPIDPGAQRLRITGAAGTGMFLIRGAGGIMLVYGIYQSGTRIVDSVGSGHTATVITEEAGAWSVGILGSALGTAAMAGLFCAPTGPIDAVCVVAGFLGGLGMGMIGGAVGHAGGHELGERAVQPATDAVTNWLGQQYNYVERSIYQLYGRSYSVGF
jgi:hypothetical protein